jgi:hypothetical protein
MSHSKRDSSWTREPEFIAHIVDRVWHLVNDWKGRLNQRAKDGQQARSGMSETKNANSLGSGVSLTVKTKKMNQRRTLQGRKALA